MTARQHPPAAAVVHGLAGLVLHDKAPRSDYAVLRGFGNGDDARVRINLGPILDRRLIGADAERRLQRRTRDRRAGAHRQQALSVEAELVVIGSVVVVDAAPDRVLRKRFRAPCDDREPAELPSHAQMAIGGLAVVHKTQIGLHAAGAGRHL